MALSSASIAPTTSRTADAVRSLPCRLGRFTLFDHVGRGGMADIYLAREIRDGVPRLVVLKEVLASLAQNEQLREMLIAEALLARQLDHRCIAQVEQLGSHDGVPFIAMEYVEGLDLNQLLRACSRRGLPVPLSARLLVVMSVLKALDHAHTATDRHGKVLGVVHRDVSPSNVLLSFDGEVKLCDFGIALAESAANESLKVVGKAGYMSPEHARGWKVDGRSDVFSAGILLWELLAGRRMYRDKRSAARLAMAARGVAPELPRLSLPDERRLKGIVERALQEDPAQRYQSARDMHQALYGYVRDNDYMLASEQLGGWLRRHFEDERIATRRARERALLALDMGPAVVMTPIEGLGEVSPVRESGTRLVAAKQPEPATKQPEPAAKSEPVSSPLELDEAAAPCPPILIPALPVPSLQPSDENGSAQDVDPAKKSGSAEDNEHDSNGIDTELAPPKRSRHSDEPLRVTASHRRAELRRTGSHRRAELRRTASHRRVVVHERVTPHTLGRFIARSCMMAAAVLVLLVCLGVI